MIKIGFLLDDKVLRKWQFEIFKFVDANPNLSIIAIFIKENSNPEITKRSPFFYRFSQALDRKIFSINNNVFGQVESNRELEKYPFYSINGIEKKYSYFFPD